MTSTENLTATRQSARVVPDWRQAVADLRELTTCRYYPEVAKCFGKLINEGTPFFRTNVDHAATEATGNLVVRYELVDDLKVCLAAIRAGNLQPQNVE